jgi:hypothetical protein
MASPEQKSTSKEAQIFSKYFSLIKNEIINPVDLAKDLYSSQIIDISTCHRVQSSASGSDELLKAVEANIQARMTVQEAEITFKKLLEVFKIHIPHATSKILAEYNEGMLSVYCENNYFCLFSFTTN